MNPKKLLSGILTVTILAQAVPTALAVDISSDSGSGQVPAKVTAEAANFSVTVPTTLPITVQADGNVITADDVKILNNSASPVEITNMRVEAQNDWKLIDFETEPSNLKVNEKKIGLQLKGNNVQPDGSCGLLGIDPIAGKGQLDFDYDANVATQTTALDKQTIANVIFTVGWKSDSETEPPEPEVEEFTVHYITDGNGNVSEDSRTIEKGHNLTFPDTTPSEGYVFDKWVDNGTQSEVTEETVVNSEMTVKALFINTAEEEAAKYYTFTDDPTTGGWQVNISDGFKAALNQPVPAPYENWEISDPLPELPATYQGKPVTNMANMFSNMQCTILDLSNFDTSNVKNMNSMFYNCSGLTTLTLRSKFNTSNVTDMASMFAGCSKLSEIATGSNFNTGKVASMRSMFSGCNALTSIPTHYFDTNSVTDMSFMFSNCLSLTNLSLSRFDTSNVTNMSAMFEYCSKLTSLDLSSFDTSKANMTGMLAYVSQLNPAYGKTQEDCNRLNDNLTQYSSKNFVVKS